MRPPKLLLGALLSGVAIAGCSLLLSTEGLDDPNAVPSDTGADAGTEVDGGIDTGRDDGLDTADATVPDTSLADTGTSDAVDTNPEAEVAVDAGPEAAVDAIADSKGDGRFCNAVDATFCEDFDDDAALAARFTVIDTTLGTLTKTVTGPVVSAPGALSAQIGTGDAGYLTARAHKTFAGSVNGVEIDFDAYLEKRGTQPTPLTIRCNGGAAGPPSLYFQVLATDVQLLEEVPVGGGASFKYNSFSGAKTVADATWIHVRVMLDTKGRKATLEIDGLLLTTAALDASWVPSQTMVGVGQAGGTNTAFRIDNVVIRLK